MRFSRLNHTSAFTLVEIAVALGLAGFCLVAVIGLLPAGINSNRASLEQTHAAGIAAAVEEDLRALGRLSNDATRSPRFRLLRAPGQAMQTLFLGEDGNLITNPSEARYRVTVRGPGPAPGTLRGPLVASLLVTTPAAADPDPTEWPSKANGRFEALVMIPKL